MYYKGLSVTGSEHVTGTVKFPEEAPSGIYEVGVVISGTTVNAIVTAFNISDTFGKYKENLDPLFKANYPYTYISSLNGYYPYKPTLPDGYTNGIYFLSRHESIDVIPVKFFVSHTKSFSEDVFSAEIAEGQSVEANVSWYVKQISE